MNFLSKTHCYNRDALLASLQLEPAIVEAMEQLDGMSLNADEQEIYEARLKWLRYEAGAIKLLKQRA